MTPAVAGPLDAPPGVTARQAQTALDEALDGLPMGRWDQQVRDRVLFGSPDYVATLASWICRARQDGADRLWEVRA